jgi:hypothetical protein
MRSSLWACPLLKDHRQIIHLEKKYLNGWLELWSFVSRNMVFHNTGLCGLPEVQHFQKRLASNSAPGSHVFDSDSKTSEAAKIQLSDDCWLDFV